MLPSPLLSEVCRRCGGGHNRAECGGLPVTDRVAPAKAVSFDMAGTLNSFMSQAAAQALDEARIKALTARFNRALSDSLTAYQRDHRAVIIVAPAVVGGAEDITADIQQSVAARMAEGK